MYPKLSLYIDGQFIGAEGRREQDVYNPATGEVIKIKASKKVAFRASKELKEAI